MHEGTPARQTRSALSHHPGAAEAAGELAAQFGDTDPRALFFFSSAERDGAALGAALAARYPRAVVVGCTAVGGFVEGRDGTGGVAALAFGPDTVRAAAAALARFDGGDVDGAVRDAAERAGRALGVDVRGADAARYAGVVLVDGNRARGDATNHALAMAAPQMVFVGGSASDAWQFAHTRVFVGGEAADDGAVLVLLDMAVPFTVVKTCSFVPQTDALVVTRADEPTRTVHELDGRPAAEVYAEIVGVPVEELGLETFMRHPLGMVLEGEAFIRSPHQVSPERGLSFQARVDEGMGLHVMRGTDLIGETRGALLAAGERLGGRIGGALSFNCALRLLEMNAGELHQPFLELFDFPMAGFHTFGESYLVQLNHTYTGLAFA
jgi:hypothetical protein